MIISRSFIGFSGCVLGRGWTIGPLYFGWLLYFLFLNDSSKCLKFGIMGRILMIYCIYSCLYTSPKSKLLIFFSNNFLRDLNCSVIFHGCSFISLLLPVGDQSWIKQHRTMQRNHNCNYYNISPPIRIIFHLSHLQWSDERLTNLSCMDGSISLMACYWILSYSNGRYIIWLYINIEVMWVYFIGTLQLLSLCEGPRVQLRCKLNDVWWPIEMCRDAISELFLAGLCSTPKAIPSELWK